MCAAGLIMAFLLGILSLAATNLLVIMRVTTLWDHNKARPPFIFETQPPLMELVDSQDRALHHLRPVLLHQPHYYCRDTCKIS